MTYNVFGGTLNSAQLNSCVMSAPDGRWVADGTMYATHIGDLRA